MRAWIQPFLVWAQKKSSHSWGLGSALSLAHAHRTTRTRNYFLHIFSYFFIFPFSFTFPAFPLFSSTTQNYPGKDHPLHPVSVSHFDLHFSRKILVKLGFQIHVNCVPGSSSPLVPMSGSHRAVISVSQSFEQSRSKVCKDFLQEWYISRKRRERARI